jgi:DNA repair protein RadC
MKKSISELQLHEVEIHYKRPIANDDLKIKAPEDAVKLLRQFVNTKKIDYKEFFWVLLLNNSNQLLGISEIAVGTTNGVSVNIKEVFQLALLSNATCIIVAHNHPSGKLKASEADKRITEKLTEASKLLDLTLLDHLIITSEDFICFSECRWE